MKKDVSLKPLELVERAAIIEALDEFKWKKSAVADHLEITRTTLWRKLKLLGINQRDRGKSRYEAERGPNYEAAGFRVVPCTNYVILMLGNFEIGDNIDGWPEGLPEELVKWAENELKVKHEE